MLNIIKIRRLGDKLKYTRHDKTKPAKKIIVELEEGQPAVCKIIHLDGNGRTVKGNLWIDIKV